MIGRLAICFALSGLRAFTFVYPGRRSTANAVPLCPGLIGWAPAGQKTPVNAPLVVLGEADEDEMSLHAQSALVKVTTG